TSWLAAHRDLWLTNTLRVVTHAGGPLLLAAFALPIAVAAAWRCRSWRPVVLVLVCGGGIPLVLFTAKALVGRERPPVPFALVDADGYSFPSGHATGTAAITVITAWMLTRWLIPWWTARVVVWTVAIGSVFLIGFSRVYLGVHYVSDVLAGWMLGIAWAGVVMLAGFWWDSTTRAGPRRPDA
ncbi:phosphatase PAP2 family protein, partial [Mycobacterium sp. 1165178.9]|uniref:phosphatase PAP2 family protein n=1 Tax=Mycobacterium sp. 1165178.9 TaxID=1834070 RepID=UPI000A58F49E